MPRKKRSAGLGDTVEKITKATGIEKVVKKVLGEDCGCQERKEFLNNLFPYVNKKVKCMNEEQIAFYESFKNTYIASNKSEVKIEHSEIQKLISLYNTVFQVHVKGCLGCNIKTYIDRLEKVYQNASKED